MQDGIGLPSVSPSFISLSVQREFESGSLLYSTGFIGNCLMEAVLVGGSTEVLSLVFHGGIILILNYVRLIIYQARLVTWPIFNGLDLNPNPMPSGLGVYHHYGFGGKNSLNSWSETVSGRLVLRR